MSVFNCVMYNIGQKNHLWAKLIDRVQAWCWGVAVYASVFQWIVVSLGARALSFVFASLLSILTQNWHCR